MAPTDMPIRTFKCKCGEMQAKLTGDPVVAMVCHCHSCVACCRYVDEKYPEGTSLLANHGAGISGYKPSQVEFQKELTEDMFGMVKVGPNGKGGRIYAKCCGTLVIPFHTKKFIGLNTNCIYEQDGSKYEPAKVPINIQKKHAFDPSVVPEPSHDTAPLGMIFSFIGVMANPFGPKLQEEAVFPDIDKAEVVEITWE